MEHQNADENTRYLMACENVKKIVNAIKSIKIKYYPNFAKISDEDKKVYEQLEENLEKISQNNNLNKLKVALMDEVSAKYDKKEINNNENKTPQYLENELLACYGAIDAQQRALSHGKLRQAKKCQDILKQYLNEIDSNTCKELVTNYKREKFGELIRDRDLVKKRNEDTMSYMRACYNPDQVMERQYIIEKIEETRINNSIKLFNETKINTEEFLLE